MIQIKKPKNEHDNYCTCCGKPFEDSMQILFSHKGYNFSSIITLCGKCRRELMEALSKADSNSALDHIHNVVRDDAYRRGYEQGKADANCPEIPDSCNAETVEAIPTAWIEAEIKKLRDLDFELATMTAGQIEAMLKKWREEQNEAD